MRGTPPRPPGVTGVPPGASVPLSVRGQRSAGRARATTRARSRDWSASSGGTSWSPSRVPRASRPSTMLSPNSAAGARRRGCGATRRPSAERLERDRQVLLPLPPAPYDACDKRPGRASSLSLGVTAAYIMRGTPSAAPGGVPPGYTMRGTPPRPPGVTGVPPGYTMRGTPPRPPGAPGRMNAQGRRLGYGTTIVRTRVNHGG